ncbi:MAG TPA: exonuclease SbcCD subunit D [Gemmataceae bacterium]|jgi:DNA repair exonuclease SbcCD nuclease subunit|nr:exonuclease SbcCD subunit D [Gemmataceae bacterium]
MKILHTADWHLGDRLGRIDRTDDLRRAVERVARYCDEHRVDVLLIAGDLFSELSRPDNLRASIEHLQEVFEPFLLNGGTILAITGNHDNENFCQTLGLVMKLAAPATDREGDCRPSGRLYLATNPTFLRLADRDGREVQFILMPYPTPTRYLRDAEAQKYGSLEEKNRHLQIAYARRLREIQEDSRYSHELPTVLAAHIHVQGATLPTLFRISEQESIIFDENDLPTGLAYVALGHVHQPQMLRGMPHVRYSGSIERLDLGERRDDKGVVLLEIDPREGLRGEPVFLPIEATPIYAVELHTPLREGLRQLREQYPDARRDLVKIEIRYTAGVDNLEEALRELEDIFPRWYARSWAEIGALGPELSPPGAHQAKSFEDTVRDYLRHELMNYPEADRDAILARAEALMKEVGA